MARARRDTGSDSARIMPMASTAIMIGGAILPSLFKQDPRYFYKGTGSVAFARDICDRQLRSSARATTGTGSLITPEFLGGLASGGISNLYYPASDRSGVAVTFENSAIGTAESAVQNLIQEFLIRHLTPRVPSYATGHAVAHDAHKPAIDSTSRFISSSCCSIDSTSLNCARQRSRLCPSRCTLK